MKQIIYNSMIRLTVSALLIAAATAVSAQPQLVRQRTTVKDATVCGLPVSGVTVKRDADLMTVAMQMQLSDYDLLGDRATLFAPVLVNGSDSLEFDPVGLYSRIRYIQYLRDGRDALGGERETSYRYTARPATMEYARTVPYAPWMNGATLYMKRLDYGCCHTLIDEDRAPLAAWRETAYTPAYHYVTPAAEKEKMRELKGRAYIDFPVNMTDLYPEYRKNPRELEKIIATIDSVRNDKDITVKRITIKGWASPESPWENNTRLAKGRTATLKAYVQNLYRFPEGFIETDYYPEDWEGLRAFVASSGLTHKYEILALIDDTTIAPDPKEDKLKKTYPEEYRFLLETVYPGLRHSDYTIEYTIRGYSDVVEIAEVMRTQPSKLSLNEMYLLAATYMPGSDAYNEVMETAARMYPRDETAIVNAASAAMQRGDLATAERYLSRAGTGAEVLYARGVLAGLQRDYEQAIWYMEQAVVKGNEAAAGEIEQLKTAQQFAR